MTNFLKLIHKEEQNAHADTSKCNNGGGYFMPCMEYEGMFNGSPIGLTIDDTSCGEFGHRYDVYVDFADKEYSYQYDGVNRDDSEEGNIPKDIAEFIRKETGYYCLFRR